MYLFNFIVILTNFSLKIALILIITLLWSFANPKIDDDFIIVELKKHLPSKIFIYIDKEIPNITNEIKNNEDKLIKNDKIINKLEEMNKSKDLKKIISIIKEKSEIKNFNQFMLELKKLNINIEKLEKMELEKEKEIEKLEGLQ